MVIKKNNFGEHPEDFKSKTGSGIRRKFHGVIDKETGELKLIEDEPENFYEYIQSFKDSVDINKIVERFRNGEIDILDKVQGVYADLSNAPKDLMDAYSKIEDAKYNFERLPVNIKEKFNYDFGQYLSSFGTDDWIKKVMPEKQDEEEVKEEVKE